MFGCELDTDNALNALVTVFPGHHQPHRGSVLFGQGFSVESGGHHRERVQGLVHPQALGVGPGVVGESCHPGHFFGPQHCGEGDKLGLRFGLGLGDKLGEGESTPRHYHRPGLDAAEPIHTLFVRKSLEQVIQPQFQRVLAQAIDLECPRVGAEAARQIPYSRLGSAEFVEIIVVGGHLFVGEPNGGVEVGIAFSGRECRRLGKVGRLSQCR